MNTQTWTHQIVSHIGIVLLYSSILYFAWIPRIFAVYYYAWAATIEICTCVYVAYGCQKCIVGHHVCVCVCGMDVSVVKFIQFHSHSYSHSHSLTHKPVHTMVFICFIPWSMRNLKNLNPPSRSHLSSNVEPIPSLDHIITIKSIYANARFSRVKRMNGRTTSCTRTQIHKCCTIPTMNIDVAKAL